MIAESGSTNGRHKSAIVEAEIARLPKRGRESARIAAQSYFNRSARFYTRRDSADASGLRTARMHARLATSSSDIPPRDSRAAAR
jgi:hypothetical protein